MSDDDPFVFSDDDSAGDQSFDFSDAESLPGTPTDEVAWKMLIVDDDNEIHTMTKMVLSDYMFEGRPLDMHSVYSGKEAIEYLADAHDIALVLLDVVMESDEAGLECARDIRDKLGNHTIRIILRTGQPGQAPEEDVISNYDINDYKEKTELTAQKLFTSVTASLRSYQHIKTIEHSRRGLENIIAASRDLFEHGSFTLFAAGVAQQLISLLELDSSSLYINLSSISVFHESKQEEYGILSGTGEFAGSENKRLKEVVPEDIYQLIMGVVDSRTSLFSDNCYIGYFETKKGEQSLIYLSWQKSLSTVDRDLISIFSTNVAVAFENISLNNEIKDTQREVIFTLSEVVEGRSKETADHIRRVAAVSCMLARKIGMNEQEIEILRLAAPMHDIGKIGTPDSILKKPGKLTDEEYEVMKQHAELGHTILGASKREMMVAAANVAKMHHEKWNGSGYPDGLKGEDIHIYGRIVALADVVDALSHRRCYKDAWSMDDVVRILNEESGEHFDPTLVDILVNSLDEYQQIQERYPS